MEMTYQCSLQSLTWYLRISMCSINKSSKVIFMHGWFAKELIEAQKEVSDGGGLTNYDEYGK